jgi:hypothetical protein
VYKGFKNSNEESQEGQSMIFRTLALLAASGVIVTAPAQTAPVDENIATSYTALGTSIMWRTAGINPPISSGTLGPFNRACAILEGTPSTKGDILTRSVYVLDEGNGDSGTVVLYIYKRTDTITSSGGELSDVETIVLHRKGVLSLTSQAGAVCYMAANGTSVFASTNANDQASMINKKTFQEAVITQQFINVGPKRWPCQPNHRSR